MTRYPFGALIIHGFTSSLDCVSPIGPPVEALGLPTRMPVLRGHGAASPEALRTVQWRDWVDDAEAALQDLLTEADQAIIIGHKGAMLKKIGMAARQELERIFGCRCYLELKVKTKKDWRNNSGLLDQWLPEE